jgi:hypothetical protein
VAIMKAVQPAAASKAGTRTNETRTNSGTVRVVKQRRVRRGLPPLDLRTPSGRRQLPY